MLDHYLKNAIPAYTPQYIRGISSRSEGTCKIKSQLGVRFSKLSTLYHATPR